MDCVDIIETIGSHADASTRVKLCVASKEYMNLSHDFLRFQKVMKQLDAVSKDVRDIVMSDNQEFYEYLTDYGDPQHIFDEESDKWDTVEFMTRFWDYHFDNKFSHALLHMMDNSNF